MDMNYDKDSAQALVEKAAGWFLDESNRDKVEEVQDRLEPAIMHYVDVCPAVREMTKAMVNELIVLICKSILTGFYYGKNGFPERQSVPGIFEEAFKDEQGNSDS